MVLRLDGLALRRLDRLILCLWRLDGTVFRAKRVDRTVLGFDGDGHEISFVLGGLKGLTVPRWPFFLRSLDGATR